MTAMDLELILVCTVAIATLVAGMTMVLAMHRRQAGARSRS